MFVKYAKYYFILFLFAPISLFASIISGKVTNLKGEALPYVSVYIKNSTIGTTTNIDGEYTIELENGHYELIFQSIGYQKHTESIDVSLTAIHKDIVLKEEVLSIEEVKISARGEDPAYRVIRNAIRKRKFYLEQVKSYSCDTYIKGVQRLAGAPKKFMGQDIGDMGGRLDSTGTGIVYLSESESKYYVTRPNKRKELMVSSRVAGKDNGFSWNSASAMDFSIYENQLELGQRPMISPIAEGALMFYNYKLEAAFYDDTQRLINKIKLSPKNIDLPAFSGYIYIVEDDWNVQSVDLTATKQATKIDLLDSLTIRQVHIPLDKEVWRIFSQTIEFKAKVLVFKIEGVFLGVFKNYSINPNLDPHFFDAATLIVQDSANQKTANYWEKHRPIPLTNEEKMDYQKKDSLKIIWKSKRYLDSIDARNNKFKLLDLFSGYSYENSYKRQRFTIQSPINTLNFNTVQGWNLSLRTEYRKNKDDIRSRWWNIETSLGYGFSEKRLRGMADFTYHFNKINQAELNIRGGITTSQYNTDDPIGIIQNELFSLLRKLNYMKLYEKTFAQIGYEQEAWNGVFFRGSIELAKRNALTNHSNLSWRKKLEYPYMSNNPLQTADDSPAFPCNDIVQIDMAVRLRIAQKYLLYPDRKINTGSDYPTIWLRYQHRFLWGGGHISLASAQIDHEYSIGLAGNLRFFIDGGYFLSFQSPYFIDAKHFLGNQTLLTNQNRYIKMFKMMPYYDYSVQKAYIQTHIEHDFNGFIFNKIPILKKLNFTEVIGFHHLYTPEYGQYWETNIGIDKIGWGLFRFLRVDYVWAFRERNLVRNGWVIGLNLPVK